MSDPLLFVSAGDPSGDRATARVIEHLKEEHPNLVTFGLGGERLKKLGQEQLAAPADLAVMGFWEVAKRYGFFRRLMRSCVDEIRHRQPKLILLVDYPGFNLRLAKRLKPLGIPIVYYISPQVWAWGRKRVQQIHDYVDRMLVILPFEEAFFGDHGTQAEFVGHYLMEDIPSEYIASAAPGNGQLGLLPGSRRQEIERILPGMLEAAGLLHLKYGQNSVVAAVTGAYDYEPLCRRYANRGVTVRYDDARRVVAESDVVLTKSGTATLECGIIGRPMVVVYKTGWITYQIARRLVELDKIALVNLVLGEKAVPELIQGEMAPKRMADEIGRYLDDNDYRARVSDSLSRVPGLLGGAGASQKAADAIARYL